MSMSDLMDEVEEIFLMDSVSTESVSSSSCSPETNYSWQACRNPGMLESRIPARCDICSQF